MSLDTLEILLGIILLVVALLLLLFNSTYARDERR